MKDEFVIRAVQELRPTADWYITGGKVTWQNLRGRPAPTDQEVEAKALEIENGWTPAKQRAEADAAFEASLIPAIDFGAVSLKMTRRIITALVAKGVLNPAEARAIEDLAKRP